MQTNNAVVRRPVRDSPSQRLTTPMNVIEGEAAAPDGAVEMIEDVHQVDQVDKDDEGDRDDGENWFENNVERGVERLPAGQPLVIDDEPTQTIKR